MGGERLKSRGKSKRSETPLDGHRSAKIFSRLFRCPPPTHTTCPWPLSSVFLKKPKPLRKIPGMKEQVFAFGYIVCYNGHDICENDVPQGVSVRGLHAAEIGQRLK